MFHVWNVPTFTPNITHMYIGKYSSTMEHLGYLRIVNDEGLFITNKYIIRYVIRCVYIYTMWGPPVMFVG